MSANGKSNSKWFDIFLSEKAIWQHKDHQNLHVKTSMMGEHVDAYFNTDKIVSKPRLLEAIARDVLIPELAKVNASPDWVFSYAPYGLFNAYECAKQTDSSCGYTLPSEEYITNFVIPPRSKVLVVADDIYSGSGTLKTIASLEQMGTEVLPIVYCLANMSNSSELKDGRKIVSAVKIHTNRYSASECPLCKAGSKAVSSRPNWDQLTK